MLNIFAKHLFISDCEWKQAEVCTRNGCATEQGKPTHQGKANTKLLPLAKLNQAHVILFVSFSKDEFVRWTEGSDDRDGGTISGEHKDVSKINMVRDRSSAGATKSCIPTYNSVRREKCPFHVMLDIKIWKAEKITEQLLFPNIYWLQMFKGLFLNKECKVM